MRTNYLLTILSEDRKGLISIITSMLNRKGIEMESIHAAKTDSHNEVLITIEVWSEPAEIKNMAAKIGSIIEVYQIDTCTLLNARYQKIGFYAINKEGYNSELFNKIQKHGATMIGYHDDEIIVQKVGRDEDLQRLHNELDSPYLKRFRKSAGISLQPLEEQSSVISKAA